MSFSARQLHVVTAITNPRRYAKRYKLYRDFAARMLAAGVTLWTVEVAFGARQHEITLVDNPQHVQLRTDAEIWHKENALNIGIQHLSRQVPDWEYVAWVDADVTFARHDWAVETIHQLQHHHVVQMFSRAHDLSPTEEIFDTYPGFVISYRDKMLAGAIDGVPGRYLNGWHPGYAWAYRREAIDALGGLHDVGILGSSDQHMARALIGRGRDSINSKMHPNYLASVDQWQARAERHIRRNIGMVDGAVLHHWHGRKVNRGYNDRWKILRDLQYDPVADLKRDAQGLYQLVDDGSERSIELRDRIRAYFSARNEDGVDL